MSEQWILHGLLKKALGFAEFLFVPNYVDKVFAIAPKVHQNTDFFTDFMLYYGFKQKICMKISSNKKSDEGFECRLNT